MNKQPLNGNDWCGSWGFDAAIISYLKGPAYFQETGYYKIVLFLSFLSVSMTIAMQL